MAVAGALVAALSVGALAGAEGASAAPTTAGASPAAFDVPDAALTRPLGEIAQGAAGGAGYGPQSVAGLGIPLGGVGAGSFMINQAGTFGPWAFGGQQNGDGWQNWILPQAAFHYREAVGGSAARTTTLATEGPDNASARRSWGDPLAAWNLLGAGDGTYSALYPFGWIDYGPFETDVALRFYSPFAADQDELTSLPVAYFDLSISNSTDEVAEVSTMFTMPNAAPYQGGTPATVRAGLVNTQFVDGARGITGITMAANDAGNTPDAYKSEWTIAAKPAPGQNVTYVTSWNANGDGADVYAPFTAGGALPGGALDSSNTASAIAVSATLQPGEATVIPFVLTWDFPQVTYDNSATVWMRRYTEFYGAKTTDESNAVAGRYNEYVTGSYPFNQSRNIATDALAFKDENLRAVLDWWEPVATNDAYPALLRNAALNQLYQLPFKNTLWANGLVRSSDSVGRAGSHRPNTHVFYQPDAAAGSNPTMGSDVGAYGYLAYNLFVPSIERDRLVAVADAVMFTASRNPDDPKIANPYITREAFADAVPGTNWFLDDLTNRIFRMYAYSQVHRDQDFLRYVYPAMKRQLAYLQDTIAPGTNLPLAKAGSTSYADMSMPNTYNAIETRGRDEYNSSLYILALECAIASGTSLGESDAVLAEWREDARLARDEFERVFWDSENEWYRYTEYPDGTGSAVLLSSFFAQHVAEQVGLPDVVDPGHYRAHLASVKAVFGNNTNSAGDPIGASNLEVPIGQPGFPITSALFGDFQANGVWAGANYFAASTYYGAGLRLGDEELKSRGLAYADVIADRIWDTAENGYEFNGPEQWSKNNDQGYTYPGYERLLAVWDALNAISPVTPQTQLPVAAGVTGAPPAGQVGQAYSHQFTLTGHPAPTVSVTAGELPPGLQLSPDGALSGVPTVSGEFTLTITASNGRAADATLSVTVAIRAANTPPTTPPPTTPAPTTPPPSVAASVDKGSIAAGERQTVYGSGFSPGEEVVVSLDGQTLGTARADSEGKVVYAFTVPVNASVGRHVVRLAGDSRVAEVSFEVTAQKGEGLAVTGFNAGAGLVGVFLLIAVGTALVAAEHRRKAAGSVI
ncbi:MAG: hypothetical protein LBC97_09910 [Bifidobacteriaceae bacterium]|nr:hypothetical protein [Bifidobacteriaceae bacterium]